MSRTTRTVLRTASAVTLLDAVGYPLAHAFLLDATAGSDPAAFALALMDFPVPFLQMVLAAVLALLALAVALRSGWMHRLTEREVTASYVVMVGAGVLTIPLVIVLACCAVLVLLGALFVVLVFAVLLGALTG
ncbi:hypothetical protein [Rathayibacter oskolensis]|uniref:hypothetical protein n=1 Tax=Rathayibacter oskolensis TaxID=1891671 RepID=UPI00101ADF67|nr:hypothetical protein [Rathayibacter oskolensis]